MMGATHYAFGAMFTAGGAPIVSNALGLGFTPEQLAVGVAIGTVAGVLPDIDHPDSIATKGLIPPRWSRTAAGKAIGWYLSIPPRVVGVGARATMNHRGGTHSALFMVGWSLLATPVYALMTSGFAFVLAFLLDTLTGVLPGPDPAFDPGLVWHWLIDNAPRAYALVAVSVFLGYFAHLFSDSLTKVPIPWPWPFSKKRFFLLPKGLRVTTDSFVENKFIRPVVYVLTAALCIINIGIPLGEQALDQGKKQADRIETKQRPDR